MGKRIAVILCIITVLILAGHAQQTRIRVLDDTDGQPVPFCHICLENRETGKKQYVVGNINGEADILLSGEVILSVSAMGYEHFFAGEGISGEQLDIRLKPSYFGLDEVVVTGQYKPVRADRSIYDIKIIGKPAIENRAANTMADILSKELNFKTNHSPATGTSLNLQGISGENVKILVNGVPLIGRLEGNIDLTQINLENVDHIEIVEGPMSVMYGSNALAGVVNIITKENRYAKLNGDIKGYYESVGIYNINASTSARFGKHGVSINGGRNFFGGFSLVDSSRYKEYKPKEQYVAGAAYRFTTDATSFKYSLDFFKENLLDRSNPAPPYYEIGYETWTGTTRLNNSAHLNHTLTEHNHLHLLAAYSYYDRSRSTYRKDLTDLSRILTGEDQSVFHAIAARGGFNHSGEDLKLGYQAGFDINTELGLGDRLESGREFMGDYALFASLQWKPILQFTFQPALRVSYNTAFKSPVTPSLNLKYHLSQTVFRISYARGFRAPSLKELYLNFYDSNHELEGNPDLIAERSHNFNIAVSNNRKVASKPVDLKGKVFYNVIEDRISLVQVDPDNPLHYRNVNTGHFQSVGGDLKMGIYPIRNLSLDAGISYIGWKDSYYKNEDYVFSPSAIGSFTLTFLKNRASASAFYKFTGNYPALAFDSDEEIVVHYLESYHNMDLNLSVKLLGQKVRLSTGIKNLFNNTRLAGIGGGSGHGGGSFGGTSSLVGWGRTLFLGLDYSFTKY